MEDILEGLRNQLNQPGLLLTEPNEVSAFTTDWTRKFSGTTPAVLRPKNLEEVSRCVLACRKIGLSIIPQGGNTSMVGGSVPRNGEVILSLSRLNKIEHFDQVSATVQVQAGVVLEDLQEHLGDSRCVFPVDLGARGSCQIGGMIATNAGGIKVLRYGHMREQVLGLEVVLADGAVLSNLNNLKKNNTGLDLKHLFVGSEGILGVITRAVLQAQPRPLATQTALLGINTREKLPQLLTLIREKLRGLSSLEIITRNSIELCKEVEPSTREPFDNSYPACIIVEEETDKGELERDKFLNRLSFLLESGLISDAIVAEGETQTRSIWKLRDGVTEAISRSGLSHKFDVTVPPSEIPGFLDRMENLGAEFKGLRTILFGHLGDGNIHVNMVQKPDLSDDEFLAMGAKLAKTVYGHVATLKGSISAEHGIGIAKRS